MVVHTIQIGEYIAENVTVEEIGALLSHVLSGVASTDTDEQIDITITTREVIETTAEEIA